MCGRSRQQLYKKLLGLVHVLPLVTQAWANLAYMDDLFGRLFGVLDSTGLSDNTYVFLLSDNGAYLTNAELAQGRQVRDGRISHAAASDNNNNSCIPPLELIVSLSNHVVASTLVVI